MSVLLALKLVFLNSLLLQVSVSQSVDKKYVLCQDTNSDAELEGEILSPNSVDISQSSQPVNCVFTIDRIPAGSWVGVFNAQGVNLQCPEHTAYLSIYHPKTGNRTFCKPDKGVILNAYSALPAHLQFELMSARGSSEYRDAQISFKFQYKVARPVYAGVNQRREEKAESEHSIVSHSTYPDYYRSGIDSTLTLTGLKLAATGRIMFAKISFNTNCQDYLQIDGLKSAELDVNKICSDINLLGSWMEFRIISANLSFQFVTNTQNVGRGFRLNIRVDTDSGCPNIQIANSRVDAELMDIDDQVFTVTCDEGRYFKCTKRRSVQVSCENGNWSVLTECHGKYKFEELQCVLEDEGVSPDPNKMHTKLIIGISVSVSIALVLGIAVVCGILVKTNMRNGANADINLGGALNDRNSAQPADHETNIGICNSAHFNEIPVQPNDNNAEGAAAAEKVNTQTAAEIASGEEHVHGDNFDSESICGYEGPDMVRGSESESHYENINRPQTCVA